MDALPVTSLRLHFRASKPVNLGAFPGAVWRGALGARLREQVCVTRRPECAGCPVVDQCPYPLLFETRVPADPPSALLRHNGATTPPFVLVPDPEGDPRDPGWVCLGLNLVGHEARPAALLVRALQQAGAQGIGRSRIPLRLEGVEQALPAAGSGVDEIPWHPLDLDDLVHSLDAPAHVPVPPAPPAVEVRLVTPLRMRIRGRYVTPQAFEPVAFVRTVLRRATHLGASHSPGFDDVALARAGREAAGLRLVSGDLRWRDLQRYSARQGRSVPMGGLVGTARIAGEALTGAWPWLWQGQWWHAGKGATMGLGQYRLRPLREV